MFGYANKIHESETHFRNTSLMFIENINITATQDDLITTIFVATKG